MRLRSGLVIPPFKYGNEHRPWGHYGLYADNERCTTKILYIKQGEMLSLQYHFKRDQFYLILDGNFVVEYSKEPVSDELINEPDDARRIQGFSDFLNENMVIETAPEGSMFGFKRKVIHRTLYQGDREYGRVLDIAFGTNDEEDIVRLQDKYGRT